MSYFLKCLSFLIISGLALSFALVEDLSDQLSDLEEGEVILFEYSFEGCYGPYHHGSIEFSVENDSIQYLEKSFDDKGKQAISQAGQYGRSELLELLKIARNKKSKEILGNTITYRILRDAQEVLKGADRIEQRHFIEIFHPFTNIFPREKKSAIPGLNTGGFVH